MRGAVSGFAEGTVKDDAQANDISMATLRRAKKELGVVARKGTGKIDGKWLWELPKPAANGHDDL